jgi:ABC-type branched-subunit amino acid transport system substrate-binding protein
MTLRRHILLGAAALSLASLAQAQSQGIKDNEIVLGTHLDLSGPVAAGMPMLRNAMQMRIDEVNAAGGIHGRKIRLIVEDNGSQPQMAVRAVQKLVRSDQVFAIVNPFGSGTNAATVKMATDAGVIVFGPWAASGIIQKVGGNSPLLFTTVQNYDSTTATGVSWAVKNWKTQRVGVIYQEGPFGDLVRAGVNQALKEAGGFTVAAEAAWKAGDIDFSSQVARMKAANVDLIIAGTITRETVGVMAETRKLGWNVRVLTTLPGRSSIVVKVGKEAVEGLYGIGGWRLHDPDSKDPVAQKFMTGFKQKFNMDADENAANSYSYMSWFLAGLEAAGRNLTTDAAVKALQASRHSDFTTYTSQRFVNNHVNPELASIDQVKGGKWVQVAEPANGIVK